MNPIFDLNKCNPISLMSTLSMVMHPSTNSVSRNSPYNNDDLPLPVLPTMPTLCPASTLNETFFKTGSKSFLYVIVIPMKLISPLEGQ